MAKRKQSPLLTNFGFTSEKLSQCNFHRSNETVWSLSHTQKGGGRAVVQLCCVPLHLELGKIRPPNRKIAMERPLNSELRLGNLGRIEAARVGGNDVFINAGFLFYTLVV